MGVNAPSQVCVKERPSKEKLASQLKSLDRVFTELQNLDLPVFEEHTQHFIGALTLLGFQIKRQLDRLNDE